MHRFRILAAAIAGTFVLAACADNPTAEAPAETTAAAPATTTAPDATSTPADAETSASFNDADIEFLQGMVPHHSQAVEMAQMVPDNTDRPELNELAEMITASQNEEIELMQGYLAEAGEEPAGDSMEGMDGGMGGMSGMMDDEEMQQMMGMSGEEFDLMFVEMMTRHHEGAIDAAEQVLETGENPDVAQLAGDIIEEQEAEIQQMSEWQEQWS
ncbi:DUF305 domain-containing protein [soil metagenome]